MKFLAFLILLFLGAISHAYAQSSPGLIYGQVPTAAQWNGYFTSKQDNLGFTPLNKAGDSMTGRLVIAPSTTSIAGINLSLGVAPLVPNNGDLWATTMGLFAQIGGTTVQIATPGSGGGAGSFTTLAASGTVSGAGFTSLFAIPPPIGSSSANTGAFTNLSASGTITGSGFTSLFTSLLGTGLPATFGNLQSSGTVSGAGFTALFASPPPIGSTAPSTGAFTTISAYGSSSGNAIFSPQANAGTPTITIPTTSGTIVTSAVSPLSIDSSTGIISLVTSGGGPLTINRVVFTTTGTYTPTTNMKYADIECQGGGGGSGGTAAATTGAGIGGGSGGTYSKILVNAATIGASKAVTIGGGGTGGANTGATGGTGGATTVGATICTAPGGLGSVGSSSSSVSLGAASPAAGTGDISVPGSPGGMGQIGAANAVSGNGGSAVLGPGGLGCTTITATACSGAAGTNYGGGAGGPVSSSGGAAKAGSAGAPGIVVITEYIQQ